MKEVILVPGGADPRGQKAGNAYFRAKEIGFNKPSELTKQTKRINKN